MYQQLYFLVRNYGHFSELLTALRCHFFYVVNAGYPHTVLCSKPERACTKPEGHQVSLSRSRSGVKSSDQEVHLVGLANGCLAINHCIVPATCGMTQGESPLQKSEGSNHGLDKLLNRTLFLKNSSFPEYHWECKQ